MGRDGTTPPHEKLGFGNRWDEEGHAGVPGARWRTWDTLPCLGHAGVPGTRWRAWGTLTCLGHAGVPEARWRAWGRILFAQPASLNKRYVARPPSWVNWDKLYWLYCESIDWLTG